MEICLFLRCTMGRMNKKGLNYLQGLTFQSFRNLEGFLRHRAPQKITL